MNNNTSSELDDLGYSIYSVVRKYWTNDYFGQTPTINQFVDDLRPIIDQSNRQAVLEVLERIEKANTILLGKPDNGDTGPESLVVSEEIYAIRKELEAGW